MLPTTRMRHKGASRQQTQAPLQLPTLHAHPGTPAAAHLGKLLCTFQAHCINAHRLLRLCDLLLRHRADRLGTDTGQSRLSGGAVCAGMIVKACRWLSHRFSDSAVARSLGGRLCAWDVPGCGISGPLQECFDRLQEGLRLLRQLWLLEGLQHRDGINKRACMERRGPQSSLLRMPQITVSATQRGNARALCCAALLALQARGELQGSFAAVQLPLRLLSRCQCVLQALLHTAVLTLSVYMQ